MTRTLEAPNFQSEKEEAEWWDSPEGQAASLQVLQEARQNGTLRRRMSQPKGQTPTTTIRLDPKDIELAKTQAEQRGLRKMLIHQALRQKSNV